jgi:hypothetical protein
MGSGFPRYFCRDRRTEFRIAKQTLAGMLKNMKYTYVAIAAACTVLSLTCAPRAEAGGRGTRIDDENGAGCMSTYTTNATNAGSENFTPGGTYANITACTPNFAGNPTLTVPEVLFPDGTLNGAALNNVASPFIATNGTMYQYYTGPISTGSSPNIPGAQVSIWTLANSDTEIELNGWCLGGSGASFKFDGNTFAGGCATTSPTDLLFNSSGSVLGFISYANGDAGSPSMGTLANLTGWTENGGVLGGTTVSAPEIDPSSTAAALALLVGGLAVMRGGRRTL